MCGTQDIDGEPVSTGDVNMDGHGVDHGHRPETTPEATWSAACVFS